MNLKMAYFNTLTTMSDFCDLYGTILSVDQLKLRWLMQSDPLMRL